MYETIRIVESIKPKYIIWENVKNLLAKKHRHNFENYLKRMESLGYTNYYQVLNAKDYGIPQNRERVFTVSIRSDIQKDFKFPEKEELKLRLKDMLEKEVDEKYYLSQKQVERMQTTSYVSGSYDKRVRQEDGVCSTLAARDWKDPKCVRIGGLYDTETTKHQAGSVWDKEGLAPTIETMTTRPDILGVCVKNANKQGYDIATIGDSVNLQQPNSKTRRGRVGHEVSQTLQTSASIGVVVSGDKRLHSLVEKTKFEQGKVLNMDLYNQTTNENISQCLTEPHHNSQRLYDGLRIRKLTPKECWRLMGFTDNEFEKAERVNSNSQLYKQAGNSIVVDVLVKILKNLLEGE